MDTFLTSTEHRFSIFFLKKTKTKTWETQVENKVSTARKNLLVTYAFPWLFSPGSYNILHLTYMLDSEGNIFIQEGLIEEFFL